MPKVIALSRTDSFSLPLLDRQTKRKTHGLSTADFRRLLSELKSRPPSQRAFLRKLLSRAIANGAPTRFPVTNHAVPDPVVPS
jgi:hypothetical protein